MKTHLHQASGVTLAREIAQPHVETFAECFPDFAAWNFSSRAVQAFAPRRIEGRAIATELYDDCVAIMRGKKASKHSLHSMDIGPFLHFSKYDRDSLAVSCADWVLSRIAERTIIVPHDRMSFEVCEHGNGWALVLASHGSICGSVWLAYIRAETIPDAVAEFPAIPRKAVNA